MALARNRPRPGGRPAGMPAAQPPHMRYLGTDDAVNTCDCCGRTDLKSTVEIELESGDVVHYGVVCAARALRTTAQVVKAETRKADEAARKADEAARHAAQDAENARWNAWLWARAPITDWAGRPDRILQIQALGGFAAARAAYRAGPGAGTD